MISDDLVILNSNTLFILQIYAMLHVNNISFGYPGCVPLFDNFGLKVTKGKLCVLYGPSWSGKTTLLKILWGVREPQSGNILFEKKDIYALSYHDLLYYRWVVVGFHFQDYNLLYDFSIKDNIMLPYTLSKQPQDFDEQRMIHLCDILELQIWLDILVKHLSGGQQERVSLLRALIQKPKVLLLDEPGANLHADLAQKIYALILDYARDNYVVVATHDEHFISLTEHTCYIN